MLAMCVAITPFTHAHCTFLILSVPHNFHTVAENLHGNAWVWYEYSRMNMTRMGSMARTMLPISLQSSQKDCLMSGPEGEIMNAVPYAPTVDSIMYTRVAKWLELAHVIGFINRFMHNPSRLHWNAVKHVFIYLVCTKDDGILFGLNETSGVVGWLRLCQLLG